MREIKFRAYYQKVTDDSWVIEGEYTLKDLTDRGIQFDQERIKWVEWTGLKDRDGEEIYEGDILSFVPVDSKKFGNPYKPFVVFWDEKDASFSGWSPRDKVEIIGNVYEQPELME